MLCSHDLFKLMSVLICGRWLEIAQIIWKGLHYSTWGLVRLPKITCLAEQKGHGIVISELALTVLYGWVCCAWFSEGGDEMETDEEADGGEGEEAPVDDKAAVVFTTHTGGSFLFSLPYLA